jgi:hypothetical protein
MDDGDRLPGGGAVVRAVSSASTPLTTRKSSATRPSLLRMGSRGPRMAAGTLRQIVTAECIGK